MLVKGATDNNPNKGNVYLYVRKVEPCSVKRTSRESGVMEMYASW